MKEDACKVILFLEMKRGASLDCHLSLFTYPSSICHSLEFLLSFPSLDLLRHQEHEKMARRLPDISQLFRWRSRGMPLSLENYRERGTAAGPGWITILRQDMPITCL
jgi:hypothetical protein